MQKKRIIIEAMIFFFILNSSLQFKIHLPKRSEFLEKIVEFIIERQINNLFQSYGSRVVVLDGTDESIEIFQIISERLPDPTIVTKLNSPYMNTTLGPSLILLLLKDENRIEEAIEHVRHSKLLQPAVPTVMIKLTQVGDGENFDIVPIMETAWKKGLNRFLLIYNDGNFRAISYNPFTSSVIDLSNKTDSDLFPYYLRNFQKYTLRVGFYEEWPLLTRKSDALKVSQRWFGRDMLMLKIVTKLLNATVRIVEPPPNTSYIGAKKDILEGRTDLCFVRRFFDNGSDENFSYSHTGSLSSLSVIVHKHPDINMPTNIVKVFRREVWFCMILTMIILLAVTAMFSLRKPYKYGVLNVCLDFWRIILNIPLQATAKNMYSTTIPLVTCIFASLVLTASFQSRLIDLMNFPDKDRGIETLDDLESSGLPVYSSLDYVKMQGDKGSLSKQMHKVSYKELLNQLDDPNSYGAVVLPFVVIRGNTNNELQEYLERKNKTVLKEPLLKSYAVYTFPKLSQFEIAIHQAIFRQNEYGLMAKLPRKLRGANIVERNEDSTFSLKIRHVLSAFHYVIIGLSLSIAVFILEVMYDKGKDVYHKIFQNS